MLGENAPWWKRAWREVKEVGFLAFQWVQGSALALAPLCKVDQEFRAFISKDCLATEYVESKCGRQKTDLEVPISGSVSLALCDDIVNDLPGDMLKLHHPYRDQGPRLGEFESAWSPKGMYHAAKKWVQNTGTKVKKWFADAGKTVKKWFHFW